MQVRPDERTTVIECNGHRVLYRAGARSCPVAATGLGTAVLFCTDDIVVVIDLCGRDGDPTEGRRLLDTVIDSIMFTA